MRERIKQNKPFVIAFLVGAVVLTVLPFLQRPFMHAPDPIAQLGSWELVDESGKPFGSVDLKGKVWIASFFFTTCPSLCPKQQSAMANILPHLADLDARSGTAPVVLVSFSVDPETDTPAVLSSYASKLGAPVGKWKWLTAPSKDAMKDVLVKRFLVAMGDKSGDLGDIAHASKFALVDQNGDLRGFWDTDELARGNLINAARVLAKEGPRP